MENLILKRLDLHEEERMMLREYINKIPTIVEENIQIEYLGKLEEAAGDYGLSETFKKHKVSFKSKIEVLIKRCLDYAFAFYADLRDEKLLIDEITIYINEETKKAKKTVSFHFQELIKYIDKLKCMAKNQDIELKMIKEKEEKEQKLILMKYCKEVLSIPTDEDNTEIGTLRKDKFKSNSKSFGIAVYCEESFYNSGLMEKVKLEDLHLPVEKEEILEQISLIFEFEHNEQPLEIVVGHEHGKNSGKCFYQVCVFLDKYLQKMMEPFSFFTKHGNRRYIGMFQATTNSHSIRNYSKKPDLARHKKHVKDGYDGVHSSMTLSDFSDHIKKSSMRDFLHYGNRMISNFVGLVQEREVPEFSWNWPEHLDGDDLKNNIAVQQIKQWYTDYCLNNPSRKKALLLYSKDRGFGKSRNHREKPAAPDDRKSPEQ